jgi:predicted DNA-binding transcriptional regulator YafY
LVVDDCVAIPFFNDTHLANDEFLDPGSERDPEFDVEDFLLSGWGITRMPDQEPEDIELVFNGPAANWVGEENWHPTQQVHWLEDGRVRFCLRLPVTEEFSRWVLGYGSYCEVIRPDTLRDWIQSEAQALLRAG